MSEISSYLTTLTSEITSHLATLESKGASWLIYPLIYPQGHSQSWHVGYPDATVWQGEEYDLQ